MKVAMGNSTEVKYIMPCAKKNTQTKRFEFFKAGLEGK